MIDIHAHVLPGIDDGPANMGEALELVRAAAADNITTIVASPHMLDGVYNASRGEVFAGVAQLNEALREHGIHVTLLAGADVHADAEIPSLLRRGELVTVADGGKYLMLELPSDVVPSKLDQLLFGIQLQGARPIISHPERNRVIQDDPAELISLVQAGCFVQVTAASILGDLGSRAEECAKALFDYQLVHLVATDMHNTRHRRPRLSDAAEWVRGALDSEEAEEIMDRNPEAVIHGGHIEAADPVPPKPRKKWLFW